MDPLARPEVNSAIMALPKADLHLHQETRARQERIEARRAGRAPYDWRRWARRVHDEVPAGMPRLEAIYEPDLTLDLGSEALDRPEAFVDRVVKTLEEAAAAGAVLVEVRFGPNATAPPPELMGLFRAAEGRARERYPRLYAEAIAYVLVSEDPAQQVEAERRIDACLEAATEGLSGVDFSTRPYDAEAAPSLWTAVYRLAERVASASLGITVHVGEFSPANLGAALRVPGLKRLGHAVYATSEPRSLDELARSGVAVECSLTSNVVLGAVASFTAHPIRQLVGLGIPVTLNTDLPVHLDTTIGHEYALAATLGFSSAQLLAFTRNAIRASFTTTERRAKLLAAVDAVRL
jgi:adenosine deaminase